MSFICTVPNRDFSGVSLRAFDCPIYRHYASTEKREYADYGTWKYGEYISYGRYLKCYIQYKGELCDNCLWKGDTNELRKIP